MKSVLITGGSGGIGLATANAFIKQGATVYITGKNPDNLKKAATEINSPDLKTIVSDLTDLSSISALAQTIADNGKKLDVLFLNAGIGKSMPIAATTEADYDLLFNTNVKGLYFTLQKLIPHLADGASVTLTSSGASISAVPYTSLYSATKAAVDAIARVAASELSDRKIRVNVVSPGPTDTGMFNGAVKNVSPEALQEMINKYPLKRIGKPEEIANTVVFLASNEYINGAYLSVDGGLTLRSKI